jgi:cytochrome P450
VAGVATDSAGLRALPYLDAVYRETLRMYPVVPTPSGRRLTREAEIGDWVFPAGTTLLACSYLVHRRLPHYPAGDRFRPERFVGRRLAPHVYFPFGGGVRRCAGEALAELEFKVALATILERWRVEAADEAPLRPVRHGTLLAPPESFRVRLRPVAGRGEGRGGDA